jgi:hypothetical protein
LARVFLEGVEHEIEAQTAAMHARPRVREYEQRWAKEERLRKENKMNQASNQKGEGESSPGTGGTRQNVEQTGGAQVKGMDDDGSRILDMRCAG